MSKINDSTFTQEIQTKIDAISTASTAEEYIYTALAVKSQNKTLINYVTSTNSLPDIFLCKVPNGQTVFVQDIGVPVIANNEQWRGLDGRLLRSDAPTRELWAWGRNNIGQLGIDSGICRSSPVSVVGGFTDWCQVSAGYCTVAAVRTNGTVWTWGNNNFGQLGDGTTVNKSSPISVVGEFTNWCQVSAGRNQATKPSHVAAVRSDGTLWTWGYGGYGQLGNNSIVARSSPVSVVGGFTDWCQVAAGSQMTAALRNNGTLWTWGSYGNGRLGVNFIGRRSSPVSVVGGFTDWCQVSAGLGHVAAVRSNGTLWTWGAAAQGQLGDDAVVDRSSPVSVIGGFADWCQVSAGSQTTAAVRTNGEIWTWGSNYLGRLGDGTTVNRSSPVQIVGGITNWCQVASGLRAMIAVTTNGIVWDWGSGSYGELGDGTAATRSSPVSIVGGFTDWCQVSSGWLMNIALRQY